jgi:hypothetical protein
MLALFAVVPFEPRSQTSRLHANDRVSPRIRTRSPAEDVHTHGVFLQPVGLALQDLADDEGDEVAEAIGRPERGARGDSLDFVRTSRSEGASGSRFGPGRMACGEVCHRITTVTSAGAGFRPPNHATIRDMSAHQQDGKARAVSPRGTRIAAYQMTDYLEQLGVEVVFGLCGHTVIGFLDALGKSRIRFVTTRHEQTAAHAADGYARVTGKPGVVLSHLGPGLTNAATGVANAALDSIPMVVIAGDVQSYFHGGIRTRR